MRIKYISPIKKRLRAAECVVVNSNTNPIIIVAEKERAKSPRVNVICDTQYISRVELEILGTLLPYLPHSIQKLKENWRYL